MARLRFPDDRSTYIYGAANEPILKAGPLPLIIYTDAECTQLANVAGLNGVALAGSIVHIGSDGLIQEFLGPADGTSSLFTRAFPDQPSYELFAAAGPRIDDLVITTSRVPAYTHVQGPASTSWTIPHGLGYRPAGVVVKDGDGITVLVPDLAYVDVNTVTLTFSAALSGTAYLS